MRQRTMILGLLGYLALAAVANAFEEPAAKDNAELARLYAGGATTSTDYYNAAMVYQHGSEIPDYDEANRLALKAVEIDPTNKAARWLAAAAKDRSLMWQGKPQLYGTQFKKVDGRWILWEVDPTITDEERARWNVPPLDEARKKLETLNAKPPA